MMRRACALLLGAGTVQAAAPFPVEGTWHVSRGIVAPWVAEDAARPDVSALLGQRVTFRADRVEGPGVLACGHARYERDERPLAGLFQGNLPQPHENAAGGLALTTPPIASVSLACDTGLFDLHFATRDALLLGLDNVVWVLDRSPGALAPDGTPEHAVQALLQDHYAHGLDFSPERAIAQRGWLSTGLQRRIATYFSRDFPEGDAPPIDGDPFTDSQDYPPVFSVRESTITGDAAVVPVRFDSGYESRQVRYRLRKENGAWHVDDIDYGHDMPFSELLRLEP
jgi:hypothetical protein